jgi:cyanate permease
LLEEKAMSSQRAFYWWSAITLLLVIAWMPAVAQEQEELLQNNANIVQATTGAPRQVMLGDCSQIVPREGRDTIAPGMSITSSFLMIIRC